MTGNDTNNSTSKSNKRTADDVEHTAAASKRLHLVDLEKRNRELQESLENERQQRIDAMAAANDNVRLLTERLNALTNAQLAQRSQQRQIAQQQQPQPQQQRSATEFDDASNSGVRENSTASTTTTSSAPNLSSSADALARSVERSASAAAAANAALRGTIEKTLAALLGDIAIELERRKFDYTLVAEATRATFLVRELEKRDVGGVLAKHKDLKADVLKTLQERFRNLLSTNKKNNTKFLANGVVNFFNAFPLASAVLSVTPMSFVADYWLDAMHLVTTDYCNNSRRLSIDNGVGCEMRALHALLAAVNPNFMASQPSGSRIDNVLATMLQSLHAKLPNFADERPTLDGYQLFNHLTADAVDRLRCAAAQATTPTTTTPSTASSAEATTTAATTTRTPELS